MALSYLACKAQEKLHLRMFFGYLPLFDELDRAIHVLVNDLYCFYRESFVLKWYQIERHNPYYMILNRVHWMFRNKRKGGDKVFVIEKVHIAITLETVEPKQILHLLELKKKK